MLGGIHSRMSKVDVYIGGYLPIEEITKPESERLASNECMIGMPVTITCNTPDGLFRLQSAQGNSLGILRPKNRLALRNALENGWTCRCWLSLVWYDESDKLFHGEVVYQCFHVKDSQTEEQAALETYLQRTSEALAAGKRPRVVLTCTSYDQVIETKGEWQGEDSEPLPISTKRGSGTVIFKRKRSVSDKLALSALERKPGCRIALTVVLLVIVIALALGIWKCTMG